MWALPACTRGRKCWVLTSVTISNENSATEWTPPHYQTLWYNFDDCFLATKLITGKIKQQWKGGRIKCECCISYLQSHRKKLITAGLPNPFRPLKILSKHTLRYTVWITFATSISDQCIGRSKAAVRMGMGWVELIALTGIPVQLPVTQQDSELNVCYT